MEVIQVKHSYFLLKWHNIIIELNPIGDNNVMYVVQNGSDDSNDNGYVSETNRVSRRTVVANGSDSGNTFFLPTEMT